jgi:hypothetical protein
MMDARTWLAAALVAIAAAGAFGCEDDCDTAGTGTVPAVGGAVDQFTRCGLMISEFMADVSSPVAGKRWLEIYNASGSEAILSNVKVIIMAADAAKPKEIDLRKCPNIPPGRFLWVRIDGQPLPVEEVQGRIICDFDKSVALATEAFEMWIEQKAEPQVLHRVEFGAKTAACDGNGLLAAVNTGADQSVELQANRFQCQDSETACEAWKAATQDFTSMGGAIKGKGTPGAAPVGETIVNGAPAPAPGEVALTEIMYRSSDANHDADWFELFVLADSNRSLLNCKIGDGTESGEHTIASDVLLAPGDYVLLSSKHMEGVQEDYLFGKPNLNMTGDRLYLRCPDGAGQIVTIFDLDFTSTGPYPVSDKAASVQFCPGVPTDDFTADDYHKATYWSITTEGKIGATEDLGSPGLPNNCGLVCTPDLCNPPCVGDAVCKLDNGACKCQAALGSPVKGDVALTEIMYQSSDDNLDADWIELTGLAAGCISLKGCQLQDDSQTGKHTIASDVAVCPGKFTVLSTENMPDPVFEDYIMSKPNLNGDGDRLILRCPDVAPPNDLVEFFNLNFKNADKIYPVPAAADGAASISVCPNLLPPNATADDYHNPANWQVTKQGHVGNTGDWGSPGNANVCAAPLCNPPCNSAGGYQCVETSPGVGLCARHPAFGELVLTEYMSNSTAGCSGADWFEVLNLANEALRLDGCTLADAGTDVGKEPAIASARCFLPPGGRLTLVQKADSGLNFDAPAFCGYGTVPNLDKGGDTLKMFCDGSELFSVAFGTGGTFPKISDKDGVRQAAQLKPNPAGTTPNYAADPLNWQPACQKSACGDYGSPGAANPTCN